MLWQPGMNPRELAGLASTRTYPLRSSFRPSYNMAVNLVHQFGRERARELLELSFAQFQADKAVVGLARQLRKAEEALDGYAEAATCHRGRLHGVRPDAPARSTTSRRARARRAGPTGARRPSTRWRSCGPATSSRCPPASSPGTPSSSTPALAGEGPAARGDRRAARPAGCRWSTSPTPVEATRAQGAQTSTAATRRCGATWPRTCGPDPRPGPSAAHPTAGVPGRRPPALTRSTGSAPAREHPCHGARPGGPRALGRAVVQARQGRPTLRRRVERAPTPSPGSSTGCATC